jgi:hypothetical protein
VSRKGLFISYSIIIASVCGESIECVLPTEVHQLWPTSRHASIEFGGVFYNINACFDYRQSKSCGFVIGR